MNFPLEVVFFDEENIDKLNKHNISLEKLLSELLSNMYSEFEQENQNKTKILKK